MESLSPRMTSESTLQKQTALDGDNLSKQNLEGETFLEREKPLNEKHNDCLNQENNSDVLVTCPNCQGNINESLIASHILECPKIRKCQIGTCRYAGNAEEFMIHFVFEHRKETLQLFDKTISSKLENLPIGTTIADSITPRKNMAGRLASLGSTGKFYCGGKLNSKCGCCNGYCGPTNGCSCRACMALDIEVRQLPKGYWINSDGAVCRKSASGRVYCGRKNVYNYHNYEQGYCGPNEGESCYACEKMASLSDTIYRDLN